MPRKLDSVNAGSLSFTSAASPFGLGHAPRSHAPGVDLSTPWLDENGSFAGVSSRWKGVSPYGTWVSQLPSYDDITTFLDGGVPGPKTPLVYLWGEDLTSATGAGGYLNADQQYRCRIGAYMLQSYPSRLALLGATAAAASAPALARTAPPAVPPKAATATVWGDGGSHNDTWALGLLQRVTVRVLGGTMAVAVADGTCAYYQAIWGPCARDLAKSLVGATEGPPSYSFPLNWRAAMTVPSKSEPDDGSSPIVDSLALPADAAETVGQIGDGLATGATVEIIALLPSLAFVAMLGGPVTFVIVVGFVTQALALPAEVARLLGYAQVSTRLNDAIEDIFLALVAVGNAVEDALVPLAALGITIPAAKGEPCPSLDMAGRITGLDASGRARLAAGLSTPSSISYTDRGKAFHRPVPDTSAAEVFLPPVADLTATPFVAVWAVQSARDMYDGQIVGRLEVDGVTAEGFPTMHLPPSVLEFYFVGFNPTYSPGGSAVGEWPHGDDISGRAAGLEGSQHTSLHPFSYREERATWAAMASPLLQFLDVLRLATLMLQETVNIECGVAALAGLGGTTGLLGDTVRQALSDAGADCFIEVFGGMPLSAAFALQWRQQMMDGLLARFACETIWPGSAPTGTNSIPFSTAALATDAPGLFEPICWMRTAIDRALCDQLFGTPSLVGDAFGGYAVVRSNGVLEKMVAGLGSGTACDVWKALPCDQRQALSEYASALVDCQPAFFRDDFDGRRVSGGERDSTDSYQMGEPGQPRWWDGGDGSLDAVWATFMAGPK